MTETLASKLAKASKDVGGRLKADKKNTQQNYVYISADKILAESGQALAEQGIVIIPKITGTEISLIEYQPNKTRWDARLTIVEIVTDGTETLEIPWAGWGSDYSVPDKAAYKAITSGDKYFRMKLLSIGEGNEDGEHEEKQDSETATQSQRAAQAKRPAQPTNGKAQPAPAQQLAEIGFPPEEPPAQPETERAEPAPLTQRDFWNIANAQIKAKAISAARVNEILSQYKPDFEAAVAVLSEEANTPA